MNKLSIQDRVRVVACLVEGNSLRSTVQMTGIHRTTIQNLLVALGNVCSCYQDKVFGDLKLTHLQCDEIWSFAGAKEKNASAEKKANGWGDIWTWTALDAKTKLVPCWHVSSRDAIPAYHFVHDLKSRLANRIQLTKDGHKTYRSVIEEAFGSDIDYAIHQKIYCPSPDGLDVRLTIGFSKKIKNHEAAVALHFMYYNFARIHQTLCCTPAMEAGIADHVWTIEEIVRLLD